MRSLFIVPIAATSLLLTGCATSRAGEALATAESAKYFPSPSDNGGLQDYRIGPLDKLNITVFQVEDLSIEAVQVDASGRMLLPLIGSVMAAGHTTAELSQEIAQRLQQRYLQAPQVSVVVANSVSQRVTVEGSVNDAGVYEIQGQTTLLQAVAMAKGPSRVAALGDVAIFRRVNGQRMAARFNLNAIRSGQVDDPEILGNDVVVVGFSNLKGAFRDIVGTLPAIAIFRPF